MQLVYAAVIDDGDKIFVARRAAGNLAGKWEFPGGKAEAGENAAQCLKRELREELNIEIDVDLFLGEVSDPDLGICLRAHRCSWLAGTAEKTDHDAFDWCALDELMELDLLELDQRLLKQLAEFLPFET